MQRHGVCVVDFEEKLSLDEDGKLEIATFALAKTPHPRTAHLLDMVVCTKGHAILLS